jgi:hypothetical protein
MDPHLKEYAGNFVLQLVQDIQNLNARCDAIEHTVQQNFDINGEGYATKAELKDLMAHLAHTAVGGDLEHSVNDAKSNLQDLTKLIDAKDQMLWETLNRNKEEVQTLEEQLVAAIHTLADDKANQEHMAELARLVDEKEEGLSNKIEDLQELLKKTTEDCEEMSKIVDPKANSSISAILNAKANKQDLRRFFKVSTVNLFRNSQKTFQQASSQVVNDYRAHMVMDIGFKYKLALKVIDHNRPAGDVVEAAVAFLPNMASAWMNCDWGGDNGRGWSIDGQKPGVGLMNLHGQHKSAILTSGDTLDILLDHHTGQHLVEFSKRGSDVRCRRRVAAQPVNLIISIWGKGGLEITEFDILDAA